MAVGHLGYNPQTQYGAYLRSVVNNLKNAMDDVADLAATMALMIDGDINDAASYAYMASKFGFTDNATAKAAYFEVLSLNGKFPDDAGTSVTATKAAIIQAANKFR